MSSIDEHYYQSETEWKDQQGNAFKLTFGFFESIDEVKSLNGGLRLYWEQGKFFAAIYTENGNDQFEVNSKHIRYRDGNVINHIESLYVTEFNQDWKGYRVIELKMTSSGHIKKTRKLDIAQAYKELWRLVYCFLDDLGEAIKYNGELEVNGNALDNALNIWQAAGELMAGKDFDATRHNERILDTYTLLGGVFKAVDYKEVFQVVKHGKSSRYSKLFSSEQSTNSLLHH